MSAEEIRGFFETAVSTNANSIKFMYGVGPHISQNNIGHFIDYLKQHTTIKEIAIIGTLNDEAVTILSEALPTLRHVFSLNLSLNYQITDSGVESIAKALADSPHITKVDLSCCSNITDVGAAYIAQSLEEGAKFMSMNLSANTLTEATLISFLEFGANTKLIDLNIPVTTDDLRGLLSNNIQLICREYGVMDAILHGSINGAEFLQDFALMSKLHSGQISLQELQNTVLPEDAPAPHAAHVMGEEHNPPHQGPAGEFFELIGQLPCSPFFHGML